MKEIAFKNAEIWVHPCERRTPKRKRVEKFPGYKSTTNEGKKMSTPPEFLSSGETSTFISSVIFQGTSQGKNDFHLLFFVYSNCE